MMIFTTLLILANAGTIEQNDLDVANLVFGNPWTPDLISDQGLVPEVVFFTETARFCLESSVSNFNPDGSMTHIMRGRFSWAECSDFSSPTEASESTIEIGSDVFFGQLYIMGEYYEIVQNDGSSLFHLIALSELAPQSKKRRELLSVFLPVIIFGATLAPLGTYHLAANAASCEGIYQTNWNVAHTDDAQTCASAIAADPSLCPSGIFMVASGQPHWNCRCCSPTGWNHHHYWNIYALDKAVISTEDFCSSGAVNADPNLCNRADCNGTPMCTWSTNRCVRNSAVPDQPITQCGVVWTESSDLIRNPVDGECSGFVDYDSGRVFERTDDFEECKRYCKDEPLCRAVTLGEANGPGHHPHCWFHYASYSDCLSVANAHGVTNACYNWIGSGQPNRNAFQTYVFSQTQLQTTGYTTWSDQCWHKSSDSEKMLEVPSLEPECPTGTIEVDVSILTRTWAYEIDWFLSQHCQNHNDNYLDYRQYYHHCCVPEQDLQLTCTDSYGDGWHGAKLTINGKQFCRQISSYGIWGRRSLATPRRFETEKVLAADLRHRQLLNDPVAYAWVMSKWAWMIYNKKLKAETNRDQDWWTYGLIEPKQDDLAKSGFMLQHEREIRVLNDPSQRFYGAAYIYEAQGNFRHWSREQHGRIGVITMCGTEPTNLADWYADFTSLYCSNLESFHTASRQNWRAGYGFAQRFSKLKSTLDFAIQDFMYSDVRDVYITGHSLGGAMGSIVAAYIRLGLHGYSSWNPSVNLVTFGAPRVFCNPEANELQSLTDANDGTFTTMRIVNWNDVVTSLPFALLSGLKHFGKVYTMDSSQLVPLADPQTPAQQDYQANHRDTSFLGIVDSFVDPFGYYQVAKLAWGARFNHIEYPKFLDNLLCSGHPLCSGNRITPQSHECAVANLPATQIPQSCAEAGKFTRNNVHPNQLPISPHPQSPKLYVMVANDQACEGGALLNSRVLENTFNPHHCANAILQDSSRCSSGFFMVAPGHASWNCRCCTDPQVAQWTASTDWKIYKAGSVETS